MIMIREADAKLLGEIVKLARMVVKNDDPGDLDRLDELLNRYDIKSETKVPE